MVAVAAVVPVEISPPTVPDETVATVLAELAQTPPVVLSVNGVVMPPHIAALVPPMAAGVVGAAVTVIAWVAMPLPVNV